MGQGQSAPESQNADIEDTTPEDCENCDDKCEPANYNNNLVGTVNLYTRHFILCDGTADWQIKKLEKDRSTFVHKLYSAAQSANEEVASTLKVTACSEASGPEGVDIYVYPEKIKYLGVKESDIPALVNDHIVGGKISDAVKHVSVDGMHLVLVCTHGTRDKRCGRSGPQVLEKVQEIIDNKGLHDQIKVLGSSHIGGHKYAGVLTVYPQGDWYGYVGAKNVEPVINAYLKKHKIYTELWRGRMGLGKAQARETANLPPKNK